LSVVYVIFYLEVNKDFTDCKQCLLPLLWSCLHKYISHCLRYWLFYTGIMDVIPWHIGSPRSQAFSAGMWNWAWAIPIADHLVSVTGTQPALLAHNAWDSHLPCQSKWDGRWVREDACVYIIINRGILHCYY